MGQRAALGPVEVDVRDEPELVPHSQADRGDAVGHGGAAHGQYLVADPLVTPDLQVGLELGGAGHRHLEEHRGLAITLMTPEGTAARRKPAAVSSKVIPVARSS
jgi:hypothetical protein